MQQTFFGRAKSIAGAALVGLGIFIFHGNLDRAATQWSHLLSTTPGEAPGVLATVILAAPRVLQAYAADHQRFLQGFLRHIFLSCWPLLLVIVERYCRGIPSRTMSTRFQRKIVDLSI